MDLMDALRTRRALREFTGGLVDDVTIEELVGAAVLAPSAVNLQPWAFAVVRGTERLRALSAEARRYALAHLPAGSPLATHVADPAFEIFHGAAVLVVICAINGETQSFEDCCLAGQNFMLAAHAKGLGTCWIGLSRAWLNDPSVKSELGIPADWHPTAPIILGHPLTLPAPTPREKARIVWCQ
ncbi:nitroreductase family protein [Mesorhizobium sp.]|uniref:nitroreductase family protein n=1 Tax=Mesorhizobium sp. TaxID=1871066 RepID=UPI000FE8E247|nr:nitroreductase family protein [Mesorhizobium sp.]RWM22789.1 MAG: nitroreductase [Mesorhizobium sp.]RWM33737.1 MAG: nitroreductase [Mesorhizobium sp.]TIO74270.1 MAG: nitroreductase [Mesorhizobium sp.]TIO82191.1 MAG: nitroreductase [Mesorhizobium sp.]TJV49161.1 MAG: nitroreductase [Mesorhizobium sp.]